ncbi:DNA methylase [Rhodobacter phage RcWata]|nr:DNA methylase [Rhodobacter phage RcWata]
MTFYNRIEFPAYYNDFDEGSVAWLAELMKQGHIPPGEIDRRSILDVCVSDLRGFRQCHFFAGIGGWAYALRLAGVPVDLSLWTGSPPCQPFSVAGRQEGREDERHLAPHFVDLVRVARPGLLLGEQVASAEVFGKASKRVRGNAVPPPDWAWIDDLSDRLEAARYAVGANDFPSAGVGAPHIRQRTYFGAVAHEWLEHASRNGRIEWGAESSEWGTGIGCGSGGLADIDSAGSLSGAQRGIYRSQEGSGSRNGEPERLGSTCGLADLHGDRRIEAGRSQPEAGCNGSFGDRAIGGLGNGISAGLEGFGGHGDGSREPGRIVSGAPRSASEASPVGEGRPGPTNGFWGTADWLFCRDERFRPVEPGTFPLVDGLPGRVGLLRGYGNAINPQAAAQFIQAFLEALESTVRAAACEQVPDSSLDGLIV